MANQEVVDYIKQNLAKGFTREQIHQTLLSAGNSEQEINECFELANLAEQSMIQTKKLQEELQKKGSSTIQENSNFSNPVNQQNLQNNNLNQVAQESNGQTAINTQNSEPNLQTQQQTSNNSSKKPAKLFFIIPLVSIIVFGTIGVILFTQLDLSRNTTGIEEHITQAPEIQEDNDIVDFEAEEQQEEIITDNIQEDDTTLDDQETQRCRISANLGDITLNVGSVRGIIASGYSGDVIEVSWSSEDEEIARVAPELGTATAVAALKQGQTRIILTDESVGSSCSFSIRLTVE